MKRQKNGNPSAKGSRSRAWKGKSKANYNDVGKEELSDQAYYSANNDWRWYASNEQLLKDVTSIPFTYALGSKIDMTGNKQPIDATTLPGIMTIGFVPTVGWSDSPTSPVNLASYNLYSYVRHANAGHSNYDHQDLTIYLLAMDSAYTALAMLKRIYGVCGTFSPVNRYYPRAVVQAMNVDFDDMLLHLNDLRAYINTMAVKMGSLCVPATMSYMYKHQWMVSGLYYDSAQEKPQTYLFMPEFLLSFTLDSDGAGALEMSNYFLNTPDPLTFSSLVTKIEAICNPILQQEDFAIMSGDILKAYGESQIVKLTSIPDNYVVIPEYREDVLDQIHNATLMGYPADEDICGIWVRQSPDKSYLVSTPMFQHPYNIAPTAGDAEGVTPGRYAWAMKKYVDFERPDVTPGMIMDATRLTNIGTLDPDKDAYGYNYWRCTTAGSEVATRARIYYFATYDGVLQLVSTPPITVGSNQLLYNSIVGGFTPPLNDWSDTSDLADIFNILPRHDTALNTGSSSTMDTLLNMISKFNRHPIFVATFDIVTESYRLVEGATKIEDLTTGNVWMTYGKTSGVVGDLNNYSVVDKVNLEQFAETALLSEFSVKQYGKQDFKV